MKADRFEFGDELILQSATRKDFVVCNPDTQSCGLEYFDQINPNHAFMFGIAEQNLVDAAAGRASCDTKVYVSTFAVFLTMRSCEQIRQFICCMTKTEEVRNVLLLLTATKRQFNV